MSLRGAAQRGKCLQLKRFEIASLSLAMTKGCKAFHETI